MTLILFHRDLMTQRQLAEARAEARLAHDRGETYAWELYRAWRDARSCRTEVIRPCVSGGVVFRGAKNSLHTRLANGKTIPHVRGGTGFDVSAFAVGLLTQFVGLHWATKIDDLSERLAQLEFEVRELVSAVHEGFARVTSDRRRDELIDRLHALALALAKDESSPLLADRADRVVSWLLTLLAQGDRTAFDERVLLHELWLSVLTHARSPGEIALAQASVRRLVEELHEPPTPWQAAVQRLRVVRLAKVHRHLGQLKSGQDLLFDGWDDGLPELPEPRFNAEDGASPRLRQEGLARLGGDDRAQSLAIDTLDALVDADWGEYSHRVSQEFQIEFRIELLPG